MEFRQLDITVIGAQGLKSVNMFSKMNLYTVVSLSGDQWTRRVTPVAKKAGKNPTWNHLISFSLPAESAVPQASLVFQIMCDRILGDRLVGQVSVPLHELLVHAPEGNSGTEHVVEYMVRTISLKTKGSLKISYKFGGEVTQAVDANVHNKADEPVMAVEDEFTNEDGDHLKEETPIEDENEFHASGAEEMEETKVEEEIQAFEDTP
ncbi:hypothetical protein RJ640_024762 [Escallonia rubra]|uniref:C2 domain-containing protein n=1 Tax=Escallonia rubra TaxID=112253 RepID=A0AA88RC34_9ASTE|nr:hypothetical protein RJ640_024762 [Escallonia rubra]